MTNRSPDRRGPKDRRTVAVSEYGCGAKNCAKGALPDRYLAINWQRVEIKPAGYLRRSEVSYSSSAAAK